MLGVHAYEFKMCHACTTGTRTNIDSERGCVQRATYGIRQKEHNTN